MSPSIVDPQSITSRITALVIFFLSLIFFIAGLAEYSTNYLSRIHPGDDMGGDGNWAELMLLGFVSTPPPRSSAHKANRQKSSSFPSSRLSSSSPDRQYRPNHCISATTLGSISSSRWLWWQYG